MKIVRKGTPIVIIWRGSCHNCNSTIEAERVEINITTDPRDGSESGTATCPVCRVREINFYPTKQEAE